MSANGEAGTFEAPDGGGLGFSFGGFHTLVAAARHRVFDAVATVGTPHRLFILDHNFLTPSLLRGLGYTLRRRRRLTRLSLVPRGRPPVPLVRALLDFFSRRLPA